MKKLLTLSFASLVAVNTQAHDLSDSRLPTIHVSPGNVVEFDLGCHQTEGVPPEINKYTPNSLLLGRAKIERFFEADSTPNNQDYKHNYVERVERQLIDSFPNLITPDSSGKEARFHNAGLSIQPDMGNQVINNVADLSPQLVAVYEDAAPGHVIQVENKHLEYYHKRQLPPCDSVANPVSPLEYQRTFKQRDQVRNPYLIQANFTKTTSLPSHKPRNEENLIPVNTPECKHYGELGITSGGSLSIHHLDLQKTGYRRYKYCYHAQH